MPPPFYYPSHSHQMEDVDHMMIMTCSPQTYWWKRIDSVNPCDLTISHSENCPLPWVHSPLPWALRMLFRNLWRGQDSLGA